MHDKPSINLFLNTRSGDFAILRFTIESKFGMRGGSGDLIPVQSEDMRRRGLDIVIENINQFGKGETGCELERMTSSQRSKFHRHHKSVGVWLDSPNVLVIQAMEKMGAGGGVGKPEGRTVLELPATNRDFWQRLTEVLDKAD